MIPLCLLRIELTERITYGMDVLFCVAYIVYFMQG